MGEPDLVARVYGLVLICLSLLIWSHAVFVMPAGCRWKKPGIGFFVPFAIGALVAITGQGPGASWGYMFAETSGILVVVFLGMIESKLRDSPALTAGILAVSSLLCWAWFSVFSKKVFWIDQNHIVLWLPCAFLLLLIAVQLTRTKKWPEWANPAVLLAASYPSWLFLSGTRLFVPILLKTVVLIWFGVLMHREARRMMLAETEKASAVLEDFERAVSREVKLRMLEVERAKQRLVDKASTDALTGALNKRALLQEIDSLLVAKDKDVFCLLMFDIDNFKQLNDKLGHVAGDMALKRVARIVKSSIREGDIFGRYGGDEFIVVFPHTPLSDARLIAERIRKRVESDRTGPSVTLSMGLAAYPLDGENTTSLVRPADEGLYLSKRKGRNCVSHVKTEERDEM